MQSVHMAFKSIMGNKMRSFLTMLGIIIGVISVVVLVSIGQGANQSVSSSIQRLGTNLLSVNITARRNNPINLDSVKEMRTLDGIAQASAVSNSSGTLKAGLIQYEDGSLIGASRSKILSQFLVEALVVSVLGGLLGLGISIGAIHLLEPVMNMKLSISPIIALLAVSFSLVIGLVFGLYPANKASRLLPVVALRHE